MLQCECVLVRFFAQLTRCATARWIKLKFPNILLADYSHMVDPEWRNGGFARFAAGADFLLLDRTKHVGLTQNVGFSDAFDIQISASGHVTSYLKAQGVPASKVCNQPLHSQTQLTPRLDCTVLHWRRCQALPGKLCAATGHTRAARRF